MSVPPSAACGFVTVSVRGKPISSRRLSTSRFPPVPSRSAAAATVALPPAGTTTAASVVNVKPPSSSTGVPIGSVISDSPALLNSSSTRAATAPTVAVPVVAVETTETIRSRTELAATTPSESSVSATGLSRTRSEPESGSAGGATTMSAEGT